MSENNLKPKKPNVVELNPLHIVQPVEIFQTLKANAKAWEEPVEEVVTPAVSVPSVEETEEVVVETTEVVEENTGLRKKQVVWAVVAAIVFAAIAVLSFLRPEFISAVFNLAPGHWEILHYVVFVLGFGAFVLAISILVRFVVGCFKKPTCFGCEFVKLGWTFVVTTVVLCVAFAALRVGQFRYIAREVLVELPTALTSGALGTPQLIAIALIAVLFVLFLALIVITVAHKAKHNKSAE